MLKIYGSQLCKDCVDCLEALDHSGVAYEFLDFSENLRNLKEFLALRDQSPMFAQVKKEGKIGIPCLVGEDGALSLTWEDIGTDM